jgi:hypothetical protein
LVFFFFFFFFSVFKNLGPFSLSLVPHSIPGFFFLFREASRHTQVPMLCADVIDKVWCSVRTVLLLPGPTERFILFFGKAEIRLAAAFLAMPHACDASLSLSLVLSHG